MRAGDFGKNKKVWALTAAFVLLGTASFHAGAVFGAGAEPGSSGDPLITQSYLEAELAEAGGFRKIALRKGATLKADSGTQLILYSGSAEVSKAGSILNITGGSQFDAGDTVAKFQSYLVPENGRGVRALSDCVFFIQGDYK